jgi:hypothetical protein
MPGPVPEAWRISVEGQQRVEQGGDNQQRGLLNDTSGFNYLKDLSSSYDLHAVTPRESSRSRASPHEEHPPAVDGRVRIVLGRGLAVDTGLGSVEAFDRVSGMPLKNPYLRSIEAVARFKNKPAAPGKRRKERDISLPSI